jgi:hypothetical protein
MTKKLLEKIVLDIEDNFQDLDEEIKIRICDWVTTRWFFPTELPEEEVKNILQTGVDNKNFNEGGKKK